MAIHRVGPTLVFMLLTVTLMHHLINGVVMAETAYGQLMVCAMFGVPLLAALGLAISSIRDISFERHVLPKCSIISLGLMIVLALLEQGIFYNIVSNQPFFR